MSGLTEEERAVYEWQLWIDGFGEEGQEKLRSSTALVSRVGGLGGPVAFELAAAGIGKIILAHGGNLKPSDLNRQILMAYECLGRPRAECAKKTLNRFNPMVEVEAVGENISKENVDSLVSSVDIVFDCAPLFEERYLMNEACVKHGKVLVEAAMYGMEGQVTTIVPGKTPCLSCIYPDFPNRWKRQFPVFGAVSALAASIAVMEGIKVLAGFGKTLEGTMLYFDVGNLRFMKLPIERRNDCPVCGGV